jgi:hypothetical protein
MNIEEDDDDAVAEALSDSMQVAETFAIRSFSVRTRGFGWLILRRTQESDGEAERQRIRLQVSDIACF